MCGLCLKVLLTVSKRQTCVVITMSVDLYIGEERSLHSSCGYELSFDFVGN